ncbi:hypothetical protein A2363_03960 [Candidatus Gottesmanbacteria bacterium RIFOXYB1_FULL_47_11]|uniref:Uncharacterized protein n=1 Tax=Candidatus Gottesmanbacteria bacterium RIFOXYB1_FULL_47_11 TaxID=1798401 RepID=A0A1F6BCZ4_9BACT|nr:MAG: hypothetical protein A2363_03960 [Candidatus Gottesmanbacteria bacterium RIFOXYB1_FULL_47_11]
MMNELAVSGSRDVVSKELSPIEKNLLRKGEMLRQVRDRAVALVQNNTHAFGVRLDKNDYRIGITAATEFTFLFSDEKTRLLLSLSVDMIHDGSTINSISLEESGKKRQNHDSVSYRLDVVIGGSTDEDYQRTIAATGDEQFDQEMRAFADAFFDSNYDFTHASISDNYAETKITTERMLSILNEAEGFEKPHDMRMSLYDFQEEVKKRGEKLPKLLSRNELSS